MNEKRISNSKLILLFTLLLTLIPVQNFSGFEFPAVYLLSVFWIYLVLFIMLGRIKVTSFSKVIIILFVFIIIEIFLSTLIGTILTFNRFYFPNDIIHYVARMLTFTFFYLILYYGKIKIDYFIKTFLILLIIGMSIGVLQWIPWAGKELLLQLYPYKDGEAQLLSIDSNLSSVRIHGWAQFATANGGLAMLAFSFAISIFLYLEKHKFLSSCLIILSILNVVISQARAGLLAIIFAIIVLYFIHIYVTRKPIRPTIKYIVIICFAALTVRVMYLRENPFIERIIYRWEVLFETSGGARVNQIKYAISLIDSPLEFLFGISRAVQSRSSSVFHIEVEPLNIFALNGLIGFILQYGLVFIFLIYFFKNIRRFGNNKQITSLLVSSFVILTSYQVFSIAYFFFREIRVGLIPWILIGATVGAVEYQKRKRINST